MLGRVLSATVSGFCLYPKTNGNSLPEGHLAMHVFSEVLSGFIYTISERSQDLPGTVFSHRLTNAKPTPFWIILNVPDAFPWPAMD